MNFPTSYLRERVTLNQVLAENDFNAAAPDYREDWERLLTKMRPGDELWRMEPPKNAIRIWGIALVRDGTIVSTLIQEVD
jgi:hypothetical protein